MPLGLTYSRNALGGVEGVYLKLRQTEIIESEEIAPGVVYDLDKDNKVVGVEIFSFKSKKA